jgi:16S rRNA (uracil1498-N3)-methyltransferase
MPRFYLDLPLNSGAHIELPEGAARHVQVLRLQPGDTITLFNGTGGEYAAIVTRMGKRVVEVEVGAFADVSGESPLQLTLVQAISASERMDYTMQKAAELGVTCIQPVISEFCQQRYSGERADKRLEHWRGVAIAACEQCERTAVPEILPIMKFDDYLANVLGGLNEPALRVLLSPINGKRLADLPTTVASAIALIGPEGGFSQREETAAIAAGFTPLLLGPRIFRTETVAPVIAALLQARYGDF